ncbi:MAG: hypothetical protein ALAOOOJD_01070 [bacterium]|nr:hypothetical protein [bacterium]
MKRVFCLFFCCCRLAVAGENDAASPPKNLSAPPVVLALPTNSLRLAPKGALWGQLAVEMRSNWQAPITRASGDLFRYGALRLDWGLAENVSLQIRGALKQILKSGAKTIADDAGDFSLATVARVLAEGPRRPACGLRIETKLPNTNQDRGIGNNTTDITMSILAAKQFGAALFFSDLGLAILSAPRQSNDQNDALVYGLGVLWNLNKAWQLAGEINGFTSPRNQIPLGTEDRSSARLGFSWKLSKVSVEMLVTKGLMPREGDWGITAGLSTQLHFR